MSRPWHTHCTRCGEKLRYGPGGGWAVISDTECLCSACEAEPAIDDPQDAR